jgi:lysophospholipase L1-like esterase
MLALHVPRPSPRSFAVLSPELASLTLASPAPVITQSATETLPRYWPSSSGSTFYQMASAVQGGVFSFCRGLPGPDPTSINYSEAKTATFSNTGTRGSLGQQWSFVHEGTRLELQIRNNQFGFLIRIDNRFVSLDPYQSTGTVVVKLDFGTHGRRRIDIISWQLGFGGVFTDPTDCLFAADLRGPRTIVFGDSFTTPETVSWPVWFGHALGWDDVWPSGVGGTGFVADGYGTSLALPDRVLSDVVPYRPEVVFIHSGLNDLGKPAAQVEAAAALTVRRIKQHLPEALVVGGADTAFGIESWNAAALDVLDAIRSGMESGGGTFLSPVELPLAFGGQPIGAQASIFYPVTAGRPGNDGTPASVSYPNGFTCATATNTPLANLRVGSVVEIGSGATRERVAITCVGYVNGRLIYGFDGAMRYAHAAGEPVREVGPCFVTGQGSTVAPSGWGNAGRFVGWDGFHYNAEGNRALGAVNAALLRYHMRGRPLI